MDHIKLSRSKKMTIAGMTFFSAIVLGGLSSTNVKAATGEPATDQIASPTDNSKELSGNESSNDTGSVEDSNKSNESGQIGSDANTGNQVAGASDNTGVVSSDDKDTTTNSGAIIGNKDVSGNSNINAYAGTKSSVATAATEVPVADSQGNTIDWNNRFIYQDSGYNTTSGIIVNYSVESDDGNGAGSYRFLNRGQTIVAGNPGDKVDLTNALPQGYVLDDSNADQLNQIIGAAQGENESDSDYINRITKNLLVKVNPKLDENEQLLTTKYNIDIYYSEEKTQVEGYPSLYFEFKNSNVKQSMTAFSPVGFLSVIPTGTIQNFVSFRASGTVNPNAIIIKDTNTKMSNQVNFVLGNTTVGTSTTDPTTLGSSYTINAPEGYKFADGSSTKDITIGAASPMYMAYYTTLGINDIDPSIHELSVVKEPVLNVEDSTVILNSEWDPKSSFVSATDENGEDLDFSKIKVNSSNLKTDTVGEYQVTFSYGNISKTVTVSVVNEVDQSAINVHNSTIHVGDDWSPSDNFDNAKSSDGSEVSLDDIAVTNNVDTTKAGTYTATYTLGDLSEIATITVLDNPTTNPTAPSADKEWLINAPYLVKADNYTQIYSSPSTANPVATRKLAHDSDWMVGLAVQNSEGTFYQVSTNEWVKAEDMWAFKPTEGVVYANDPDNTEVFSTVDANKDTDIKLSYQTAWLIDRVATDNDGNTWYRVGTSNYVKAADITKDSPVTQYNGSVQLTGTGNVPLYNLDYYGHIKKSSRNASSGTSWISNNHRQFNGTTYHQISNSEWVSELDSVFIKQ